MKEMRKLLLACFALILGLAWALPVAFPVLATPKVVGSVHTERNVTTKQSETVAWGTGHIWGNVEVKKYADGTIVGHINGGSAPDQVKSHCIQFESADFVGNTAIIVGLFLQEGSDTPIEERWTLVDNGHPAIGNSMINIELHILPPNLYGGWYSIFGLGSGPVLLINNAVIQVHDGN
jgi:hypothetical protein